MSVPVDLLARIDRNRAALAEMVAHVREHQADCGAPEARVCCGEDMWLVLTATDRGTLQSILMFALAELARHPASPPTTVGGLT